MLNLFSRCLCCVRLAWTYTYCLCSLAACEQELLLNLLHDDFFVSSIFHFYCGTVASCHHDLSRRKRISRRRRRRWWCCWRRYCCRWKSLLLLFFHDPFRRHCGLRRLLLLFCFGFDIIIIATSVRRIFMRSNFSANESPPAAGVFHAEAFNLNFFFPR